AASTPCPRWPKLLWSQAQLPVNTSSSRSPTGALNEMSRQSAAWAPAARAKDDTKRYIWMRMAAPGGRPGARRTWTIEGNAPQAGGRIRDRYPGRRDAGLGTLSAVPQRA